MLDYSQTRRGNREIFSPRKTLETHFLFTEIPWYSKLIFRKFLLKIRNFYWKIDIFVENLKFSVWEMSIKQLQSRQNWKNPNLPLWFAPLIAIMCKMRYILISLNNLLVIYYQEHEILKKMKHWNWYQ